MKKDITRRAVEQAAQSVLRLQSQLKTILYTGPDSVQLSPTEFRTKLDAMSPAQRAKVLQTIPDDELTRLLLGGKRAAQ